MDTSGFRINVFSDHCQVVFHDSGDAASEEKFVTKDAALEWIQEACTPIPDKSRWDYLRRAPAWHEILPTTKG